MLNFILPLILKSKNFVIGVIGVILLLFVISFVDNYFEAKDKVKEYQRIEAIVKTQNQNTKENVEIIKKRNINNSITDREQLLEQMFSE
jgi:beta-lactamase regulating signal transducer with metallopeptidase domain